MSGSRSNRRWPTDLEDDLFIKRPHAVEQFKDRAGYDRSASFDAAEEDLRKAVIDQMKQGKKLSNKTGKAKEFVVRVAIPGREVVYALVEEGADSGNYRYLIHTVYTKKMYDQWNEEGRLGTLGDLAADALKDVKPVEKKPDKPAPNGESKVLLRWECDDGRFDSKWTTREKANQEIFTLLAQGVPLTSIEVFRKINFELSISMGE